MTVYKIDINRGSDSNDGVTAPWANLAKIKTQALSSGDQVLLARDSIWNLSAPTSLFTETIGGVAGNPVYFGCYDTALETTAKPQINLTYTFTAGQWTYDGANNGWYVTFTYDIGKLSLVLLGGQLGLVQSPALPMATRERGWKNSGTRVYVYAPAGTNPTAYYGSVVIGPCYRSGIFFSDKGTNVLVENLSAINASAPVGSYMYAAGELTVRNVDMNGCAALQFQSDKAGSGSKRVTVENINVIRSPSAGVTFFETGTGTSYYDRVVIRNSRFTDGNLACAEAAVYLQCHGAIVEDNYVARMMFGTPSQTSDGCAIYSDLSSYGSVIRRNTVEQCGCAFQSGSVDVVEFSSNLILDCGAAFKAANEMAYASVEVRIYNNTAIRCLTPYQSGGVEPQPNGAVWTYSSNVKLLVKNNVFTAVAGSTGPCFSEYTGGYYAGSAIDNNVSYGFAALTGISYDEGGSPALTPTNVKTADPLLTTGGRPQSGSTLIGAGTHIAYSRDADGNQRPNPPSIGAYDVATLRPKPMVDPAA